MASFSLAGFITRYDGRRVSGYSSSGGQCVDLMRRYLLERFGSAWHGIPGTGTNGAESIWDVCDTDIWSKHGRASGFIPQRNALLIMRAHGDNSYGHVAIVRDDSTANSIYTFDQNFSRYRRCSRERHPVDRSIIGYLVAKR